MQKEGRKVSTSKRESTRGGRGPERQRRVGGGGALGLTVTVHRRQGTVTREERVSSNGHYQEKKDDEEERSKNELDTQRNQRPKGTDRQGEGARRDARRGS